MHHHPISIENLSYVYADGTEALTGINVSIQATERVALVGANGSGKSTLLLHLNGLLMPQFGKILVGEYELIPKNLKFFENFLVVSSLVVVSINFILISRLNRYSICLNID